MQFIPKLVKPGIKLCEGHNLTASHNLGHRALELFFCFRSGSCCGPRAKLLDNPLMVNPPQSSHKHSFSPSVLRCEFSPTVYRHVLVLDFIPLPVRWSCLPASQLLSLCRCLQTVIKAATSPAPDKLSSLRRYLSLQGMFSKPVWHPSPSSWNPLQFSLKSAELHRVAMMLSSGLKTEVMKPSRTYRLALFRCLWMFCGHKKLSEMLRSVNLSLVIPNVPSLTALFCTPHCS